MKQGPKAHSRGPGNFPGSELPTSPELPQVTAGCTRPSHVEESGWSWESTLRTQAGPEKKFTEGSPGVENALTGRLVCLVERETMAEC